MSNDPAADARDFVTFCDGLEEGGLVAYARRGRMIALHLTEALRELEGARSAVVALRDRCDAQQEILGKATYQACVEASDDDVPF